jgi:zona occludens toxin
MAISIYSGLPRSGKSYTAVEHVIIPAAKEKRQIYTNIPLDLDLFESEFGVRPVQFSASDIEQNPLWFDETFPHGGLLVLDECWRVWPAGLKLNNAHPSHKAFLAEHGHRVGLDGRSTEIVLVTQDPAQLAAFVRLLVATTYRTKKLDAIGQAKKFRIDVYEGCMTGANPPVAKRVREMYGQYKPEIYRFYKSHTQSKTGEAGNEERADKRANILKGGTVKAMLVALVILPILVFFGGRKTYENFHPKKKEISAAESQDGAHYTSRPAPVQKNEFLDGKKLVIVANNFNGQSFDYRVSVVHDDERVVLDSAEFSKLGFNVESISQCLLKITGQGVSYFVFCSNPDYRSLVSATAAGITGQDSASSM